MHPVSETVENYLTAILRLEDGGSKVTTDALADHLGRPEHDPHGTIVPRDGESND